MTGHGKEIKVADMVGFHKTICIYGNDADMYQLSASRTKFLGSQIMGIQGHQSSKREWLMALRIAPLMRASRATNMLWPIGNQILKQQTNKSQFCLQVRITSQSNQKSSFLWIKPGGRRVVLALLFNSAANSLKFSHVPSTKLNVSQMI